MPVLVTLAFVLVDTVSVGSDVLRVGTDIISEVPSGGYETLSLGVDPEMEVSLGVTVVGRIDCVTILGVAQALVMV